MTDKEKAIVMAYTGICMLTGDKFQIFHKYVEDIMNRPIMTHELGWLEDEIKEKSKADFMALCANESSSEKPNKSEIPTSTTTKNNLGVDCVARQDVERFIEGFINEYTPEEELEFINLELDGLKHLPPATPQELKPMVEIDLYSVIKQKYIEREVLDKIKAEILEEHENAYAREDNDTAYGLSMALDILDKYKSGGSKEA